MWQVMLLMCTCSSLGALVERALLSLALLPQITGLDA